MFSVASSKFLALNSLMPYLGKVIFRPSDWTAASAKKTPAWFSTHKGKLDASGLYASGNIQLQEEFYWLQRSHFRTHVHLNI